MFAQAALHECQSGRILLAAAILLVVGLVAWQPVLRVWLLYRVYVEWSPHDVRALVVTSESPKWKLRIGEPWLRTFDDAGIHVRVLNASERSRWSGDELEVRLWRAFGGAKEHTPLVIVFRGLRRPVVLRFYRAFRDAKHGNFLRLEREEQRLFDAVGVRSPPSPT